MIAGRLFGKDDFRLVEMNIPEIDENEILVQVKAAALCGSDLRMITSGVENVDGNSPLTLGHEFAGVIYKVGENVSNKYRIGQKVAVAPNFGCGQCNYCVSGLSHLCIDYKAFGINLDGAFAQYVRIPSEVIRQGNVTLINKDLSYIEAAINEPLACVQNGFERYKIYPGDKVLIMGAGAIGIMHAKLAFLGGAGAIVLNDLSEERLNFAKSIMGEKLITIAGSNKLEEFVKEITNNNGFDVIITAAPSTQIQQISLYLASVNGRICFFGGIPSAKQPIALDTNLIHYKQLQISGTTRSSLTQYRKTLSFLASGLIEVRSLVTNIGDIRKLPEFIENAKDSKGLKYVITY